MPLLCGNLLCHCPSNWAEHLLIHRIQSHTNPKRRKGFLKQAGQKSSKEELPEQRKGPKRAVECRLKVPTHIWEQDAGSSSLPTRTTLRRRLWISHSGAKLWDTPVNNGGVPLFCVLLLSLQIPTKAHDAPLWEPCKKAIFTW